jgi:hypothetical protein
MHDQPLSYAEAEEAWADLERRRQLGDVDEAAYREELNAIRVLDEYGRTWMIQETTGQWFVYHNNEWVASTPPVAAAPAAPAPAAPSTAAEPPSAVTAAATVPSTARPSQSGASAARGHAPRRARRMGCIGVTLRILLWDLVWIGVAVLIYRWIGPRMPWVLIPVALLAAGSLVWWLRRLGRPAPQGA